VTLNGERAIPSQGPGVAAAPEEAVDELPARITLGREMSVMSSSSRTISASELGTRIPAPQVTSDPKALSSGVQQMAVLPETTGPEPISLIVRTRQAWERALSGSNELVGSRPLTDEAARDIMHHKLGQAGPAPTSNAVQPLPIGGTTDWAVTFPDSLDGSGDVSSKGPVELSRYFFVSGDRVPPKNSESREMIHAIPDITGKAPQDQTEMTDLGLFRPPQHEDSYPGRTLQYLIPQGSGQHTPLGPKPTAIGMADAAHHPDHPGGQSTDPGQKSFESWTTLGGSVKLGESSPSNQEITMHDPEFLFRIASRIFSQAEQGGGRIQLQLKPSMFGKLDISAQTSAGHVSATILAESEAVKSYLENNIHILQKNLQDQGLKVDRIQVFLMNDLGSSAPKHHQDSHGSGPGSGSNSNSEESGWKFPSANGDDAHPVDIDALAILGPHSTFHTVA
jgi:hypothetical protein